MQRLLIVHVGVRYFSICQHQTNIQMFSVQQNTEEVFLMSWGCVENMADLKTKYWSLKGKNLFTSGYLLSCDSQILIAMIKMRLNWLLCCSWGTITFAYSKSVFVAAVDKLCLENEWRGRKPGQAELKGCGVRHWGHWWERERCRQPKEG